ncbi:uncharacterized protein K02A2.6-like [Malaya genurostris]|uniref:uncharacterized protein K02A2.6-like n=1 Tax=Malaya genurostris TaxID=325434 RepID=UPI0026F38F72|nr:uncharacterized protein K02A2.6-like [Malaya genurostris]
MEQGEQQQAVARPIINSSIPFPEPLKTNGNLRENVNIWKDEFETYLIASGVEQLDERIKVATFKSALGSEARRIFNLWPLQEQQRNTVLACMESLSMYMVPRKNIKLARYEFYQCRQEPGDDNSEPESMTKFINRTRELIKDCNFGEMENEMLRDKIITGIRDLSLKKRFIEQQDLTAEQVIEQCRTEEVTRAEMTRNQWIESQQHTVNKITEGKNCNKRCSFCSKAYHRDLSECPARGATCHFCGLKNHYEIACKKKKEQCKPSGSGMTTQAKQQKKKLYNVEEQRSEHREQESDEESISLCQYLNGVNQSDETLLKANIIFFDVNNQRKPKRCLLDTGASCNVIGKRNAMEMLATRKLQLDNNKATLKVIGGGKYESLGRTVIDCEHDGIRYKAVFHVVNFELEPILSLKSCLHLKLIQLCSSIVEDHKLTAKRILKQHPNVFSGLGQLDGKVHLEVDQNVAPVVQHPRRIAVNLREELRQVLAEMEQEGIIAEENQHTDWVSNLVLVKRNNKLRVCIDPILLNKALKRPHYQMPTLDELLPELANAKVFTTVDAKSGFWQVSLDEESARLTTCWTPFGRFKWLRMPMGIAPAPEIFQLKAHEAMQGLRNVRALMDDFMIFGCGDTVAEAMVDHNQNLQAFLRRMEEKNLRLNPEKIKLCKESVRFFGHILTSSGIKPDPDKVSGILKMAKPTDVPSMQRFLGTITYLARYLPSLSSVAEPLRRLTYQKEPWVWSSEQEKAFSSLKQQVTSAPILRYFDPNKDSVIQCDSSSVGLGAVLLQEGQPVVYASRTLSATERRYAQIEKETLAILFACRRFEIYILGKPVAVQTDHQPLIKIFQKPLTEAPLRIQRMMLSLQRYQIALRFTPGKEVIIADMLSRATITPSDVGNCENFEIYALDVEHINITEHLPISDERVNEIRSESQQDPEMQVIAGFIINGWPKRYDEVPANIQVYWKYKHELSTVNGLVLRNDRILIPRNFRKEILEKLHRSHSGIEATTKLARDTVFWPGINDQIKQRVQQCDTCAKYSQNQQSQPMQSHRIPLYPYQKVSMDICEHQTGSQKHVYLITVDHYSDYFDIDELNTQSSAAIIRICKRNFARFGKPQEVSSDGGSQFMSEEFGHFSRVWGFKHSVSAPYHQQANGKAESAVKIAKLLLKKANDSNQDFWELLLQWRNTPNKTESSPAQRLFNRRTRCGIPMIDKKFLPKIVEGVTEQIRNNRQQAKLYYDRKARSLPELEVGQPVFVKLKPTDKEWQPGSVVAPVNDRSTIVDVGGREYHRDNTMVKQVPAGPSQTEQAKPTCCDSGTLQPVTSSKSPGIVRTEDSERTRTKRAIQIPKKLADYQLF